MASATDTGNGDQPVCRGAAPAHFAIVGAKWLAIGGARLVGAGYEGARSELRAV